jgi:tRNA(fMet)-specific endonuclease VapC
VTDYLLDSNHASPLVTLAHPLRHRVLAELPQGHTFAICVPILSEVLFGLAFLTRAEQSLAEWLRLRQSIRCYEINETDAETAATLQVALRKKGRKLETVDALIAAVALRYNLVLLTADKDFDAVPDLQRDNWLAPPRAI